MQALLLRDGTHATSPGEMAAALNSHWAEVFKANGIDADLLQEWLREDSENRVGATGEPPAGLVPAGGWAPSHSELLRVRPRRLRALRAMTVLGTSAPGPNGIPCSASRRLRALAMALHCSAFSGP